MKKRILSLTLVVLAWDAHAEIRDLVDEDVLKQIAEETSGAPAR